MSFLHNFTPSPVLWQFGGLSIKYYGVIMVLAIIAGLFVVRHFIKRKKMSEDDLWDVAFWVVLGGLIGARLYDVILIDGGYYWLRPIEIFYFWQGGLAIHGAIIGGLAAIIIWCRKKKQDVWQWLGLIAVALPLGQAIGRFGNYFNSELFGQPTGLPWGIPITESLRPAMYRSSQYFHPAFLYEALLDFVLFVILFYSYKTGKLRDRQIVGWYLIGYGLIRFMMEFIRIDLTPEIWGWRLPQLISIAVCAAGLWLIMMRPPRK